MSLTREKSLHAAPLVCYIFQELKKWFICFVFIIFMFQYELLKFNTCFLCHIKNIIFIFLLFSPLQLVLYNITWFRYWSLDFLMHREANFLRAFNTDCLQTHKSAPCLVPVASMSSLKTARWWLCKNTIAFNLTHWVSHFFHFHIKQQPDEAEGWREGSLY